MITEKNDFDFICHAKLLQIQCAPRRNAAARLFVWVNDTIKCNSWECVLLQ